MRSTDTTFRFGGDEFIVLMPDTSISDAIIEAENLRVKVESSQILQDLKVTTSIGAIERIFGESLDQWFMRVDKALYKVKQDCRNQVNLS